MSDNSNVNEPRIVDGSEADGLMKKDGERRLVVESEERLEKIPRKDGIVEPEWDPNDIGFFLPSHYFEREDGATFRSLRESEEEWQEAVSDMSSAVSKMRQSHRAEYHDLFADGSDREKRSRALGIFLADLFVSTHSKR